MVHLHGKSPHKKKRYPQFIIGHAISVFMATLWVTCFPLFAAAFDSESDGYLAFSGEEFASYMSGRMGFDREPGLDGTLNDFRRDLGLPRNNQTIRLEMSARPLEHHMLRIYGTIPEAYTGRTTLKRELIFQNQTLPIGTDVKSDMHVSHFGLGYDLDFLLGSRYQGGANADFRFLRYFVKLEALNSGSEHVMSLDEVVPCLGGHFKSLFRPTLSLWPPGFSIGVCGRLTYGINPNYLNLYELRLGINGIAFTPFGTAVDIKVGYQVEGWNQINVAGRDLEFKREGVFFSLAAAF